MATIKDLGKSKSTIPPTTPTAADEKGSKITAGARKRVEQLRAVADAGANSSETQDIQRRVVADEISRELEKLYSPDNFRGIVKAPADIMALATGSKVWELQKDEIDTLSVNASLTAKYFLVTDPKWVALTMLAISVTTIYGGRVAMHLAEKRKHVEKKDV